SFRSFGGFAGKIRNPNNTTDTDSATPTTTPQVSMLGPGIRGAMSATTRNPSAPTRISPGKAGAAAAKSGSMAIMGALVIVVVPWEPLTDTATSLRRATAWQGRPLPLYRTAESGCPSGSGGGSSFRSFDGFVGKRLLNHNPNTT